MAEEADAQASCHHAASFSTERGRGSWKDSLHQAQMT
jgi:hypothetical protein